MAKQVFVSPAQHAAAKAIVKRNAAKGKPTRLAVEKIANASAVTRRSATESTRSAAAEAARRIAKG
jgi:hypothetical protein